MAKEPQANVERGEAAYFSPEWVARRGAEHRVNVALQVVCSPRTSPGTPLVTAAEQVLLDFLQPTKPEVA